MTALAAIRELLAIRLVESAVLPDVAIHLGTRRLLRGLVAFANALFAIWLGPDAVDERFRNALPGSR